MFLQAVGGTIMGEMGWMDLVIGYLLGDRERDWNRLDLGLLGESDGRH